VSQPAWLLIAAVIAVGVLHTLVPDHWVPITLIARQRGWTRMQTARAAFGAGLGHTVSTLAIGIIVWIAGVVAAQRFGTTMSLVSSFALIAFGGWIAIGSWREMREHEHQNGPGHDHADRGSRTALVLILGSSPMVEGIPAFFAAAKFGPGLIAVMSLCFAVSTIATYVALCTLSSAVLERLHLGPLERYGEILSGLFIMLVGIVFLIPNL
jgi:ABC-type nickel/cobalt efflux system permease component RcnA